MATGWGPWPSAPTGRALGYGKVAVLVAAFAFLAGTVGWAIGQKDKDPLSAVDVGFMQDMGYHHSQAVQMSIILLGKAGWAVQLVGRYHDVLRRDGGEWKFQHRRAEFVVADSPPA